MGAKAALGAAPDVVRKPERRSPGDAESDAQGGTGPAERDDDTDERKAEAAEVEGGGAAGEDGIEQLARRGAGNLRDRDRSRGGEAAAPTRGPRARLARRRSSSAPRSRSPGASGKQAARASAERARWPESGSRASKPLRARTRKRAARLAMPEAAALCLREGGDREIGGPLQERARVSVEVGVDEQEPSRGRLALGEGERLALAETRQPHDPGTRPLGRARRWRRGSRRRRR